MNHTLKTAAAIATATLTLVSMTTVAFAASPAPAKGSVSTVIAKGDADIATRITSLTTLIGTINGLNHLSADEKSSFVSEIQSEISDLNTQKTKLDADTDVITARADRVAIYNQFRIYMLFIPKTRILAAADSMTDVDTTMGDIATKLQTRIAQAQAQGKDVSAETAAMADLQSKIADAKTQYTNAENTVNPLVPDQGNQSVIASNQAALQTARGDIKTGAADLKAGRADITTIWNGIKAMHLSTATGSATTNQ